MTPTEKRIVYGIVSGAAQALADVLHGHGVPTYGTVIAINLGDDGIAIVGGAPGDALERRLRMADLHRDVPLALEAWIARAKAASTPAGEQPAEVPLETVAPAEVAGLYRGDGSGRIVKVSGEDDGGAS
jgi:hypothetical protein